MPRAHVAVFEVRGRPPVDEKLPHFRDYLLRFLVLFKKMRISLPLVLSPWTHTVFLLASLVNKTSWENQLKKHPKGKFFIYSHSEVFKKTEKPGILLPSSWKGAGACAMRLESRAAPRWPSVGDRDCTSDAQSWAGGAPGKVPAPTLCCTILC